jgi:chromosome segregation ATPase
MKEDTPQVTNWCEQCVAKDNQIANLREEVKFLNKQIWTYVRIGEEHNQDYKRQRERAEKAEAEVERLRDAIKCYMDECCTAPAPELRYHYNEHFYSCTHCEVGDLCQALEEV